MDMKRMSLGDEPYDSGSKRTPEEWAVTSREIGHLKRVISVHEADGIATLSGRMSGEEATRRLVSNLQLYAERSLYERYCVSYGPLQYVPDVELSSEEVTVLQAKIKHRMGSLALEEAMSPAGLFAGVPASVLVSIGNEFLTAAEGDLR